MLKLIPYLITIIFISLIIAFIMYCSGDSGDIINVNNPTGNGTTYVTSLNSSTTIPTTSNETSTDNSSSTTGTTATLPNQLPLAGIILPTNNQCLTLSTVIINGTANDPDGTISSVQLFIDNIATTSSGTTNWTATSSVLSNGSHSISLFVYDNIGSSNAPENIVINVDINPLSLEIISPTNNQTIQMTSFLSLSGTFNNPDICCANKTVQFIIDGSTTWTNVSTLGLGTWAHSAISGSSFSLGNHSVSIRIGNSCGLSSTTSTVLFYRSLYGLTWINIPGGNFVMGYTQYSEEQPLHTITLSSFWMTETEITIEQYTTFLNSVEQNDNGRYDSNMPDAYCGLTRNGSAGSYSYTVNSGRNNYPMVYVTWTNGCDFCQWLSGTLPSEAQWEYAAGGSNHYTWSLGNTFTSSDYCFNNGTTCLVKSKGTANSYGLWDMSGGVWEWVYDWYSDSSYGSTGTSSSTSSFFQNCSDVGIVVNPINLYPSSSERIRRGGCWNDTVTYSLRSSRRGFGFLPYFLGHFTGFRCVR